MTCTYVCMHHGWAQNVAGAWRFGHTTKTEARRATEDVIACNKRCRLLTTHVIRKHELSFRTFAAVESSRILLQPLYRQWIILASPST